MPDMEKVKTQDDLGKRYRGRDVRIFDRPGVKSKES